MHSLCQTLLSLRIQLKKNIVLMYPEFALEVVGDRLHTYIHKIYCQADKCFEKTKWVKV